MMNSKDFIVIYDIWSPSDVDNTYAIDGTKIDICMK